MTEQELSSACGEEAVPLGGSPAPAREPVADRIAMTLGACAAKKRPLTLVDLVQETGLAKTTLHRMCWKLVELGMLEHSADGFSVGTKLLALGGTNPGISRLRAAAIPHLLDIHQKTRGFAHLAVLSEGKALMLDGVFTHDKPHLQRLIGNALPLHCTAAGKAIAARLEPRQQEELLFAGGRLPAVTGGTIVHPGLLRSQLRLIAHSGTAYADEEFAPGVKGVASAFRLPGGGLAAVGVVDTTSSGVFRHGPSSVVAAAAALERALA